MAFYQRRNIAVLSTGQQIAFPMARNRSLFHFRRPLADRDGIDDLPARVFEDARVLRATDAALGSQVPQQLFLQHSAGLDEQATVNRFVGHAQALVRGILDLQPPGNLLGRPVQDQSTRNDVPQLAVLGKQTALRTQGRNPSLLICIVGTIGRTPPMASDLPAQGGGRSIQTSRYLTNRGTRSDPS